MSGKKSKFRRLAGIILLLCTLSAAVGWGRPAGAAQQDDSGTIGYFVRALLPENQIDPTVTYFDLRMKPRETQEIIVEIVNETQEELSVHVEAISASTSRNGVIDYKTPDVRDKTLKVGFTDIASLEKNQVNIPAQSTLPVPVLLTMPEESYDGVVLGGLVFTKETEQTGDAEGMVLNNIYSYVIGVKLSETDVDVQPEFELESVQANTVNYMPTMVHNIRNKNAAIAKNIMIDIKIYDQKNQLVSAFQREGMDMAPCSVMPLAVTPSNTPEAESQGRLVPGEYTSMTTLIQNEKTWNFEQKFVIENEEAQKINAAAIDEAPAEADNTLLIIAAAVILVLLLLLVFLLVWMKMRQKRG